MPDLSVEHINRALMSSSIAFTNDRDAFAARAGCAVINVEDKSDLYFVYGRELGSRKSAQGGAARNLRSLRMPGSEAAEIDISLSTAPYQCTEYSYKDFVADAEIKKADAPLQPLLDAQTELMNTLMNDTEQLYALICADPTTYNAANTTLLVTGTTSWKTSTSTLLTNLDTAKRVVELNCQRAANTITVSADTSRTIIEHPDIKTTMQYTGGEAYLEGSGMPRRLRGLNSIVASAVANTGAEGASYAGGYLFLDKTNQNPCAIVSYVPPGKNLGKRTLASFALFDAPDDTTNQHGISTRAYRVESRKGWMVEASTTIDIRPIVVDGSGNITGAFLFQGCTL